MYIISFVIDLAENALSISYYIQKVYASMS